MPQLDPTWFVAQLFWLFIVVAVMHMALKRFVLPRLMLVLAAREETKSSAVIAAENFKREAEAARQEYEAALAEARSNAQGLFTDAEARIKAAEARSQAALDQDIAKRATEVSNRIKLQAEQISAHLKETAVELVSDVTRHLTGQAPDSNKVAEALKGAA